VVHRRDNDINGNGGGTERTHAGCRVPPTETGRKLKRFFVGKKKKKKRDVAVRESDWIGGKPNGRGVLAATAGS